MANVITLDCRAQPIERVIVFNDRAEVKRLISTELAAGPNEIHIQNISQALVFNSVRVDGRGDAVIHDVRTKTVPALKRETDSPKVAEIRTQLEKITKETDETADKISIGTKKIEGFDKLIVDLGTGFLPKDGNLNLKEGLLENISQFYDYYDQQSSSIRKDLRHLRAAHAKMEEHRNKIQNELNNAEFEQNHATQQIIAVTLESQAGGKVQLEVSYQVYQANWTPSYDFRVDTTGEAPSIQVSYFGEINQTTGEDWSEIPLTLSTAQPCLGGDIPELGTMEVSFYRPPPPPCPTQANAYGGSVRMMKSCAAPMMEAAYDAAPMMCRMEKSVAQVQEQAMSTEFTIGRPTHVPSSNEATKVTIGIFELHPQLIYETVPSKNPSVFLTASAINTSSHPIIVGQASVYLNNSFIATTWLKNVSPGERFSCSLGVDTAIRVEYRPVKKYHEQAGIINKSSSAITEQVIHVRNTRQASVLLLVKEHLPRSTDEKIKIRLLNPTTISSYEQEKTVGDNAIHKEGAYLNAKNNLEWTVKLAGGAVQDLVLKYAIDHPKEEKIEFKEKF